MTSLCIHTSKSVAAEDRKLLTKTSRLMRDGRTPNIVFTESTALNRKMLNALADVAELAARHSIKPIIENASADVSLKLEIAGLASRFDFIELPAAPSLLAKPAETSTKRRWPYLVGVGVTLVGLAVLLSGCSSKTIASQQFTGGTRVEPTADVPGQVVTPSRVANRCAPLQSGTNSELGAAGLQDAVFGAGDVVRIDIPDGTEFSGTFAVNANGSIALPLAGDVRAAGRTASQVTQAVEVALVEGGYFHAGRVQVSVLPLRWAPMNISVAGAVFQPGRAVINDPSAEKRDADALNTIGDAPIGRYIDAGLRAGAGIRPDADLANVKLVRKGKEHAIDLTGLVTGLGTPDVPLMAGDRLEIPSSGCFHAELMRPSQATPPGMRVFMSNLTMPATGNNPSAIDSYATNLPYGTRLLQAIASANCMGGAGASNAARRVVLISNNPLSGKAEVFEHSIEDLIRNANRDDVNPYMLPNDTLACYDSGVTNLREVARTLSEMLGPMGILLGVL